MDLSLIAALGTFVFTLTNFIRFALATNWSSVLSQVLAWLAGIVATFIAAHSALGGAISIGTILLKSLPLGSQVIVGLTAASSIGIVYQFKQAIDRTDSAVVPSLAEAKLRGSRAAVPSVAATAGAPQFDSSAPKQENAAAPDAAAVTG